MHGSLGEAGVTDSSAFGDSSDASRGRASAALPAVERLCAALDAGKVRYCHWKSTPAIRRSATGDNDLDLLIATEDIGRFRVVLDRLGWKQVVAHGSEEVPGVRHYFGLDAGSGKLIDVHAHARLVIGDDATKNYRLPIEDAYLASGKHDDLFVLPSPEFEFIVLVIRFMLKHGTPEAIITHRGSLSETERWELETLSSRIDEQQLHRRLRESLPFLDHDLFRSCVRSLEPGCPVMMRLEAWRRLRPRLEPFSRRGRGLDVWLQMWRRLDRKTRVRVLRRPRRRSLTGGGRLVAVVGGDGAGKSTVIRDLASWLSPLSRTGTVHLGKPRRSVAWLVLRAYTHVGRAVGLRSSPLPAGSLPDGRPDGWSYAWLLTGALTARDRARAAVRAKDRAIRGTIVFCDRYPMPPTMRMDGPRVGPEHVAAMKGIRRRLAKAERSAYDRIPAPDILIVLRVDPEVAAERRSDADPFLVRSRAEEIRDATWPQSAIVVDANRSRELVLGEIKARTWSRL